MRNLKKLLAVIVTIAMIATFAIPAFAEGTATKTDSQVVTGLGMLKGEGAGVTDEYLATQPDRLQAAIMFLRLLGKEAEAKAFTGTDNFSDVAGLNAENTAILAYLKAHPELGYQGIGDNKFDPLTKMTAKAYYKVMLVALGYVYGTDFTWDNVNSFAAGKGLSKNIDVETFKVSDLAAATVEALKANVKEGGMSLIAKLVAAGTITADAATTSGLYTAPVVGLSVVSVKADNCKEIVVNFNKALDQDSAEKIGNYSIDDTALTAPDEVALNADGKSVTITFNTAKTNGDDFDLTVSGVKDSNGVEMDDQTVAVTIADVTAPVAQKIELTGPNAFDITFSEPMDTTGTVSVADDEYGVAAAETDGTNVVPVTLSDSELAAGNYKVVVSGYKDFAGHKMTDTTFTLKYAKDTTAPVATIKSATQTKVVIDFNEKVYNGDPANNEPLTNEYFYHSVSSYHPAVIADAVAGDTEYTLDFTDNPLPEGNVKIGIIYDAVDPITDAWGNEMTANQIMNVNVSADNTKPTVTKVETDGQSTVNVYFSEDLYNVGNAAEDPDNFIVKDSDGNEVDIQSLTYTNTDDEYKMQLGFADPLSGKYTVEVSGVKDLAVDQNEIDTVTKSFTVADETAPDLTNTDETYTQTIDSGDTASDYVYVTYPEDMATTGNYSVLNKDNYAIWVDANANGVVDAGELNALADKDTIATFGGSDKVKITIKNGDDYNVEAANTYLVVGRVADAAGNKTATMSVSVPFTADVPPAVTAVKTIDKKTIEITVGGELKTVVASGIQVAKGAGAYETLASIKSWKIDSGDTIITGILRAPEQLTTSDETDLGVQIVADKLISTTGKAVEAGAVGVDTEDGFAPSLVDSGIAVVAHSKTFTIQMDEGLSDANEGLAAQDLKITNSDGDVLVAGEDYTTTIAGDTITVTIAGATAGSKYKVQSNDTIKYIKDAAGNKANAFTDIVKLTFVTIA